MKRIVTFAGFAFLVIFYPAFAEQRNDTGGPVRLNAPRGEAPPPFIRPKLIRAPPVAGNAGASQDAPQPQSQADRPLGGQPSSAPQQVRPRAVYRGIARRIDIADGVLALPKVVYYGVPVILDVPGLGFVDVPEDEYARIYEKLSSSNSELVEQAMSSLRGLKALEEAEVEAHERGPDRAGPGEVRDSSGRISKKDLSEPVFFHSRGRTR